MDGRGGYNVVMGIAVDDVNQILLSYLFTTGSLLVSAPPSLFKKRKKARGEKDV